MKKILIYAIGNPGRGDDGLGFEFVKKLEGIDTLDILHCYQLNIEDAELIKNYDEVLFVDAAKNTEDEFYIKELKPIKQSAFTTHGLNFEAVLAITEELYGKLPRCRLLAIAGEEFNLKLGLTEKAVENLNHSFEWFNENYLIRCENF